MVSRISELTRAVNNVHQFIETGVDFKINPNLEAIQTPRSHHVVESVTTLLDATLQELQISQNLKARPIQESETLRKSIELCSKLVKDLSSRHASAEQLKDLKEKVHSAKCGGLIPPAFFWTKLCIYTVFRSQLLT